VYNEVEKDWRGCVYEGIEIQSMVSKTKETSGVISDGE